MKAPNQSAIEAGECVHWLSVRSQRFQYLRQPIRKLESETAPCGAFARDMGREQSP